MYMRSCTSNKCRHEASTDDIDGTSDGIDSYVLTAYHTITANANATIRGARRTLVMSVELLSGVGLLGRYRVNGFCWGLNRCNRVN